MIVTLINENPHPRGNIPTDKGIRTRAGKTTSEFVEYALKQFLGMEGMPLDDEVVYGRDDDMKENKE